MQHGPVSPSQTPETTTDVPDQGSIEGSGDSGLVAQESEGESFFQTWAKGQDMPLGPSLMFMAGVLLAMIVIMRSLMKSSAKRKHQTRTMGHPSERIDKINDRARGTMEPARQAMVDAEDLTRRMGAVLDNKATKIEILLAEATERIAQLEEANRLEPKVESVTPAAVEHNPDRESNGICPEALDRARLDQDRVERGSADKQPFRFESGMRNMPLPESPNPLTFPEQVDELFVQGLDAQAIATKLNRLVGEVELILNLRRNSG